MLWHVVPRKGSTRGRRSWRFYFWGFVERREVPFTIHHGHVRGRDVVALRVHCARLQAGRILRINELIEELRPFFRQLAGEFARGGLRSPGVEPFRPSARCPCSLSFCWRNAMDSGEAAYAESNHGRLHRSEQTVAVCAGFDRSFPQIRLRECLQIAVLGIGPSFIVRFEALLAKCLALERFGLREGIGMHLLCPSRRRVR